MCKNWKSAFVNFFQGNGLFCKNFDLKKKTLKIMNKKENYTVDSVIHFLENRFYRLWSSPRPPASVRVDLRFEICNSGSK